jgi:hypothetical protein
VKLITHKDKLIHTSVEDYNLDDQIFLICCWPEALVDIISSDIPREEKAKLNLVGSGKAEKVLELMADNLF